tara:strand:+ start:1209 stop:2669 length:1461 start_codon:yes stop_codon:yes gene_type:complete
MAFATSPTSLANLNTLTPRPTQGLFGDNYLSLTDMDFTKQFLPDVYEKEVERFGNRTISGFLRMVGAEMPMSSDQVVWSEQGRLHVAFDDCTVANGTSGSPTATTTVTFTNTSGGDTAIEKSKLLGVGMTVIVAKGVNVVKARVATAPGNGTITVAPYGAANLNALGTASSALTAVKVFVYGSEFAKGSLDGGVSIDAKFTSFSNKPIILRDKYSVNGSDTAQIGWVEVTSENGASGYLWYLKSEHEARLRFEDQLEMSMIEAVKDNQTASGSAGAAGFKGSEGLFAAIETRGMIYNDADFGAASGAGLAEFDAILAELDKQGAIEENMMFLDRATSLSIDNMLAAQNSYGTGGTSYGVFNNSEDMAINLGFSGFRRGSYDFYKSDWKYLNDSTTRGLLGDVEGVMVPAGTSTVYDQNLGKNIARPFLHVRYRASEADDRKMKSWITGSVGGNYTSAADEMNVHFLSERALCVQAANNFVLLKSTS